MLYAVVETTYMCVSTYAVLTFSKRGMSTVHSQHIQTNLHLYIYVVATSPFISMPELGFRLGFQSGNLRKQRVEQLEMYGLDWSHHGHTL